MTPLRIDLLPPARWRSESFPLAEKHMKDLQIYIGSGIILPNTTDLYQQELGLNSAEMDKFKDGIESVVDIYKQAREHCLRYKTDTFGKMVRLARDLYSYARDVETYYEALYRSTDFLNRNKDGAEASSMKSLALYVLEDKSGDLKRMNTLGGTIILDLRKLEQDIITDKLSVVRERSALHSDLIDGRGRIADHVETLNQIAERQGGKGEPQYRVPLVGFLPKTVFPDENGKNATDAIYTSLAPDDCRATLSSLEPMLLHADLTIYHKREFDKILGLISSVVDTIQTLHEPFQATSDGLDELTSKFQAIERDDKNNEPLKIDEIFVSDLKDVTKEWLDLGKRAREYSEVGWITPMLACRPL